MTFSAGVTPLFSKIGWKSHTYGRLVSAAFTPVLAKHTKSFNPIDTLAVGVERIERNFEPMRLSSGRRANGADTTGESSSCMPRLWTTSGRQHELFSPKSTAQFKKLDPIPYF
jgi:hypothetical protein